MQVRELGDPRLQALFGTGEPKELGVRPVVRLPRSGPSGWVFAGVALMAAILLFWVLDSRREAPGEPSVSARAADASQFAPEPPPLYIPPAPAPQPVVVAPQIEVRQPVPSVAAVSQPMGAPAPQPQTYYAPEPFSGPMPEPVAPPARTTNGPALVIDTTAPGVQAGSGDGGAAASPVASASAGVSTMARRARASALANRSATVPQGTLIPAVLETAFDSTRPGFARAIVSRDVRGFDGSRILVPRGSRLVGEYQSNTSPGQNRAMITWTRLLRPDGMMIAIDSPAVDPVGRGGVRASVNTHFWERFKGALLQTTMNVGSMFATRSSGSVLVAMPGSTQNTPSPATRPGSIAPTLKVPAGTSISIFVAHDLDFGGEGTSR